jgi:hypothetical protein
MLNTISESTFGCALPMAAMPATSATRWQPVMNSLPRTGTQVADFSAVAFSAVNHADNIIATDRMVAHAYAAKQDRPPRGAPR